MPVYFLGDLKRPLPITMRCVYCDHLFKERQELNLHYLTAHEEAFSEEELLMAHSARANLELRLKRSPIGQGS